jgi:hypothetical protein
MCQTLQGHAFFEHRPQLIKPLQRTLPLRLAQCDEAAPAAPLDVALTCVHSQPSLRHRTLKKLRHAIPKVTTYDHAISRSELRELMAASVRQMLLDAPHDAASLQALLRGGVQLQQAQLDEHTEDATILSDEARQTLAWIEALDGP